VYLTAAGVGSTTEVAAGFDSIEAETSVDTQADKTTESSINIMLATTSVLPK
jgi:hypothetical protein